jgi:hypothetical protein
MSDRHEDREHCPTAAGAGVSGTAHRAVKREGNNHE